ncbi:MAG TPA: DNA-binding response regulator [Chryseobacterium sp.]|nr:DNA-binding response regulator [Chryseobacterium sp.]
MEKFKCIIVEDEPLAAEVLKGYISQVSFLQLSGIVPDAIYALEVLKQQKIDVMFLDIHLPHLKGIDFIKALTNPIQVIITTAYREYALDGYDLNVVDYLLKPISLGRFLAAVNKLNPLFNNEIVNPSGQISSPEPSYIFININKKRIKVYIDEILYIESRKEYINIVTKDKSHLTKFQLNDIEELLKKNNFLRIHRSFIVAKEKITAFTATEIEINGIEIPIGRNYKELVLGSLGDAI